MWWSSKYCHGNSVGAYPCNPIGFILVHARLDGAFLYFLLYYTATPYPDFLILLALLQSEEGANFNFLGWNREIVFRAFESYTGKWWCNCRLERLCSYENRMYCIFDWRCYNVKQTVRANSSCANFSVTPSWPLPFVLDEGGCLITTIKGHKGINVLLMLSDQSQTWDNNF